MKAISLWRPWDLFVLIGWKTIETRTHERFKGLVGTTIAIHSAKKIDPHWRTMVASYLAPKLLDAAERSILEGGRVHGIVEVFYHRPLKRGDSYAALVHCGAGERFGLFLDHARLLENPIAIRGHQGIFNVPISEAEVHAAGRRSNYAIINRTGSRRAADA